MTQEQPNKSYELNSVENEFISCVRAKNIDKARELLDASKSGEFDYEKADRLLVIEINRYQKAMKSGEMPNFLLDLLSLHDDLKNVSEGKPQNRHKLIWED